jgi:long-chain acyl-CoA synthetase
MKVTDDPVPLFPVHHLTTFQDILTHSLGAVPNKIALEDLSQTPISKVTYAELYEYVLQFGSALKRAGLRERDHVAVISENRVQWGIAFLACTTFNYVVVPIDKNLKENEIITILHASDAKAAVFSEGYRQMFLGFKRSVKGLQVLVDMDLEAREDGLYSMTEMIVKEQLGSTIASFPKLNPEALAILVFTSGSMGRAKGVMLSQKNICTNLMDMLRMINIRSADRFLSVLPIHHSYECTCGFLCPLTAGASAHYARSLKTIVEDMQKVHPTILLGVPLLYEKMYRRIIGAIAEKPVTSKLVGPLKKLAGVAEVFGAKELRRKIFAEIHGKFGGAVRLFIVGGAAPDPRVAEGLRSFGFNFVQGYGLTETSPILAVNRESNFKDEAAGIPLPSVQIRISEPDQEGRGEILANAPTVMLGYYKNEKATADVMEDGWFHTGDFGFVDDEGFVHINGRKKNVIIARNGENVFPEELEDLIHAIPFVLESVVYGAKDASGDEEICVLLVPNAGHFIEYAQKHDLAVTSQLVEKTLNDEIRKLNKTLPIHKQIRRVTVREQEFEKTTTQKIKRYLIHQEDSTH